MSYCTIKPAPVRGLGDALTDLLSNYVVNQPIDPLVPPPPPQVQISSAGGPLPLPTSLLSSIESTIFPSGFPIAEVGIGIGILVVVGSFIGGFHARPAYESARKHHKEGKIAKLRERIAELQDD
jgi:hypothetical protein